MFIIIIINEKENTKQWYHCIKNNSLTDVTKKNQWIFFPSQHGRPVSRAGRLTDGQFSDYPKGILQPNSKVFFKNKIK